MSNEARRKNSASVVNADGFVEVVNSAGVEDSADYVAGGLECPGYSLEARAAGVTEAVERVVDFQHLECVELAGGGGAAVLGSGRRSSRQATSTSQVAVQILLQGVGEDVELASEGVAKQILQDGAVVQDLVEAWPPDPGPGVVSGAGSESQQAAVAAARLLRPAE